MTECGCSEICRLDGWADQFQPATRELMVFTKNPKRYFDVDAVRQPLANSPGNRYTRKSSNWEQGTGQGGRGDKPIPPNQYSAGAPPLDWWQIPSPKPQPVTEYQGDPMTATFYVGDAIETMNKLPEKSVDLILTSPPFLALRSYLPADHESKHLEGGSQATPGIYIDWLVDVVEACDRVLAPHGSLCIELGDTYAGTHPQNAGPIRLKPDWRIGRGNLQTGGNGWALDKSLSLIPELFRLTLVYGTNPLTGRTTERWRLRNVVRWVRPNPPVGALGDKFRPATSELMVFCKSAKRYFDLDAVREPFKPETLARFADGREMHYDKAASAGRGGGWSTMPEGKITTAGAPPLDWWNIPLLEGEEETRYGPKDVGPDRRPRNTNGPKSDNADAKTTQVHYPTRTSNEAGSPPLDWWTINQPSRLRQPCPHGLYDRHHIDPALLNVGDLTHCPGGEFITDPGAPLDWWNIPPGGYEGAHYAVFPPELCIKPIKAMCPERVCRQCGEPSQRITGEVTYTGSVKDGAQPDGVFMRGGRSVAGLTHHSNAGITRQAETLGFSDCGHDDYRPGMVLDPFGGSGTTALVATGHGRDCILIDLDERNFELALERVGPFILERVG